MATHGKAREVTINNLSSRTPFRRKGFGMSGVEGKFSSTGRLQGDDLASYYSAENVTYTVLSYGTPIAWVINDSVVIPDTKYSVTTTHHQNLCKVYL